MDMDAIDDWSTVPMGTAVMFGAHAEGKFAGYSPEETCCFILTDHTYDGGTKGYRAMRTRPSHDVRIRPTP